MTTKENTTLPAKDPPPGTFTDDKSMTMKDNTTIPAISPSPGTPVAPTKLTGNQIQLRNAPPNIRARTEHDQKVLESSHPPTPLHKREKQNIHAMTPKMSSAKSHRKQAISPFGGTPAKSPLVQGTPVARSTSRLSEKEERILDKSRKSGKTPAKSRKSLHQRVEFIPPIEYMDVSSCAIRLSQFLTSCEMFLHLYGITIVTKEIQIFYSYKEVFGTDILLGSTVIPLSSFLAALIAFRTIYGIFAINYTTPSKVNRSICRLFTLMMTRLIYGAAVVVAGRMLVDTVDTDAVQQFVRKNMAHLIRYATKHAGYMEEMNRLQQSLQCCGMRTDIHLENGTYTDLDHPWNIWFATYSLDDTYTNAIRELYSLPWSCCNRTQNLKCENIGITRYLRKFDTPTDFDDIEKALDVKQLNWNPTTFERHFERNELAINTLYKRDCSVELVREMSYHLQVVKHLMLQTGVAIHIFSLPLLIMLIYLKIVAKNVKTAAKSEISEDEKIVKQELVPDKSTKISKIQLQPTQPKMSLK